MSLILDALNRAERERKKAQTVPDLQTMHEPASPVETAAHNKSLAWLIALAVVLVVAAALYGLKLKDSNVPTSGLPASNSQAPTAPVPNPSTSKLPASEASAAHPQQPVQESPALPISTPVAVSQELKVTPPAEPASQDKPPVQMVPPERKSELSSPVEPIPVSSAQPSALDELYAAARAEESVAQSPVSDLYIAPAVESGQEEKEIASVATPVTVAVRNYSSLIEVPDLGDLPWGFRQEIPSLNYVRHNFEEGGVTSVVINGKAHYAGGTLARDLVLEEIYVDGVILRFKQIRFKLRALNSWINM